MEIPETHREQLEIWQGDPMTQWYFEQIDKERREIEELTSRGSTIDISSVDATAMQTALNSGVVRGLDFCTTFEMEGGEDES